MVLIKISFSRNRMKSAGVTALTPNADAAAKSRRLWLTIMPPPH